jgi:hypothetical protein
MMIVVVVMVMVMIMVVAAIMVASAVRVMMLMARYVLMLVPVVTDKVHGPTTGVVLRAMPCPMLLVSRWHMKVYRLIGKRWIPVNHNGTCINQRWGLRYITDIDLPEKSGLADVDRYSEVGGDCRCGDQ